MDADGESSRSSEGRDVGIGDRGSGMREPDLRSPGSPVVETPPCGARRRMDAGKRAERFSAATSVHAFELPRISYGVLCRVMDVASRQLLVAVGAGGVRASAISRRA